MQWGISLVAFGCASSGPSLEEVEGRSARLKNSRHPLQHQCLMLHCCSRINLVFWKSSISWRAKAAVSFPAAFVCVGWQSQCFPPASNCILLSLQGQFPWTNWLRTRSKVGVNPAFACTVGELCQVQVNSLCDFTAAVGTRERMVHKQGGSVSRLCQFTPAVTTGGDLWLWSWPHLPE